MLNKISQLWSIVEQEKIEVFYEDIKTAPEELNGLYFYNQNVGFIILLDKTLLHQRRKHNEVLAEEVGHHFAGVGTNVLFASMDYTAQIRRNSDENRAMLWATNFLIPDNELMHAVHREKLRSCYELADYFDVTQGFFMQKLILIKQCFRRTGLKVKGRDILGFDLSSCF